MPIKTTIDKIPQFVDQEVTLSGWLYNKRESKKLKFLEIRDGMGIIQAIVGINDVDDNTWEQAGSLTQESSLHISGRISKHPKKDEYELQVMPGGIDIVQISVDYPITPKEHGSGFLFQNRHLWLRSKRPWALMRIRSEVIHAIRTFFYEDGYITFDAPIFTPNACEGTTDLFEVPYFDSVAYLSQSGQLYGETGAMSHRKIVVFGPSFRAEKSKTRRHLTEFWHIEPEIAWFNINDNMELMERLTMFVIEWVLRKCRPELELLERDIKFLENIKTPFIRLHYDDAVNQLNELKPDRIKELKKELKAATDETLQAELKREIEELGTDFKWGGDFGAPDEGILTRQYDRPIFVHRFPRGIKAFYMAPDPEDERVSLSIDMLAPEGYGEIIGGGQRAEDYDYLVAQIKKHNLPMEAYQWYLDLRKYGTNPHGGFGLGVERTVAWLAGVHSIRECIPYPRTIDRVYP
ncbi:MAG: asparagine--tRNA ligase [bacterium]|nr:asparagine--tRNA ligase [bacterium]